MEMSLKSSHPVECAIRCQWHFRQRSFRLGQSVCSTAQCCSSLKLPVAQNQSVRPLQGTRWRGTTPTWNLIKLSTYRTCAPQQISTRTDLDIGQCLSVGDNFPFSFLPPSTCLCLWRSVDSVRARVCVCVHARKLISFMLV